MMAPGGWLPLTELVAPADEEGVAEAVRQAKAQQVPLYPMGGSTAVRTGVRPARPGRGLLTAGLNRIVDHSERDLTITVGAGTPLSDVFRKLAQAGQWLPVDTPRMARGTAGGAVAVGPIGPRRARYGSVRDYVIGLRGVDGHGSVFRAGGRVVKNAAGLDLCRLLTGSLGTLAVITEVTFMVRPRPPARVLAVAPVGDVARGLGLRKLMAGWSPLPAVAELLVGPAWTGTPGLEGLAGGSEPRLAVGIEGEPEEVDAAVARLEERARAEALTFQVLSGTPFDHATRGLIDFCAPDSGGLSVQIEALPSRTPAAATAVLSIDPDASLAVRLEGGGLFARLSSPGDAELCRRLRAALGPTSSRMVVRHQAASLALDRRDAWGEPRPEERVMKAIKERFDPAGILNPGRFVFEGR